jgi:hypothetical protein
MSLASAGVTVVHRVLEAKWCLDGVSGAAKYCGYTWPSILGHMCLEDVTAGSDAMIVHATLNVLRNSLPEVP